MRRLLLVNNRLDTLSSVFEVTDEALIDCERWCRREVVMASVPAQSIDERVDYLTGTIKSSQKVLPEVARELLDLCRKPSSNAAQIERVVSQDPLLTARVLAIANSAMFAPRVPITGIREAVVRIGLDAVQEAAFAVVMSSTMFRVPGFEEEVAAIRNQSLAAACAGRLAARYLYIEANHGFMIGLLHDVGALVLLEACVQHRVVNKSDEVGLAQMWAAIERNHGVVGATILDSWKMNEEIIEAAARHHAFMTGQYSHQGHIAAACDFMARLILDPEAPPTSEHMMEALDLRTPEVAEIVSIGRRDFRSFSHEGAEGPVAAAPPAPMARTPATPARHTGAVPVTPPARASRTLTPPPIPVTRSVTSPPFPAARCVTPPPIPVMRSVTPPPFHAAPFPPAPATTTPPVSAIERSAAATTPALPRRPASPQRR